MMRNDSQAWARTRWSVLLISAVIAQPAMAQRTGDNATTAAEDAFGRSVGDQTIGIYNANDVRGFSPVVAGNVRIEGLYFDQQADLTSRVSDGSTIRVGLSAQSYPFPAPTGIADFTLRKPGRETLASVGLTQGPWDGKTAELDVQLPLDGERLGLAGGAGYYYGGTPYGGTPQTLSLGVTARWAPAPGIEVVPFWSRVRDRDDEAQPLIFTDGTTLPKRIRRSHFFGQDWADQDATATNFGVVARAAPAGFDLRFGVFRSIYDTGQSAADLLFGAGRDGFVADRLIVIERDDRSASTSGELRAARGFDEGPRHHALFASLRARAQDRRYGGADVIDLGASRYDADDDRPEVTPTEGAKTRDRVRQQTVGVGYQAKWKGVGEMSLGLQKTRYRKTLTDPDPAIVFPRTRSNPWLPNATAALYLGARLALYAGYTRGLEESPVAPSEATNLNEAPPAIRTEQKDAGVRWVVSKGVTAVLGAFDVSKPYFNLDSTGRFRRLGQVRNRGLEMSLAGQVAPGLNVVVGNVLVDAKVSGEAVDLGLIGRKPVASFVRHTIAAVDYRLPACPALSFDMSTEATSDRVANRANTLEIPARAIFSVGGRYRMTIGKTALLARGQVQNIFGTFGFSNGSSGFFVPNGSRRWLISLAADV